MDDLLHDQERCVYGDSAHASQKALICEHASLVEDFTYQRTHHGEEVNEVKRVRNRTKSKYGRG